MPRSVGLQTVVRVQEGLHRFHTTISFRRKYMNKKLLAVAVGAALAASAAVSQADVKVYGIAHVSVDYVDIDLVAPAEATNPCNVANNSSRFGVKVNEDLGGGWSGLAQYEL